MPEPTSRWGEAPKETADVRITETNRRDMSSAPTDPPPPIASNGNRSQFEEQAVAPLAELTDIAPPSSEELKDAQKWEEICIGFWKQTRLRRLNNEPGECFGIALTIHKQ